MSLAALIQSEELHRYKTALEKIAVLGSAPGVWHDGDWRKIAREALKPNREPGSVNTHA